MRNYSAVRDLLLHTCNRFVSSVSRRKDAKLVKFSVDMLSQIDEFIKISEIRESSHEMIIEEMTFRDTRPSKAERICKLFGVNYIDSIDERDLVFLESISKDSYYSPKTFYDDFNAYSDLLLHRSLNRDFYSKIPSSRTELYLELKKAKEEWERK